jgi:dephospho-CoA kinase
MIIGIVGTLGAGKGTVVEYLKQKGFDHYSSSDILREILVERGVTDTRENLSLLADELQKKLPGGILQESYERAQKAGSENFILEAIHRVGEATFLHSVGGVLVGVDADIRVRYERITIRQEGTKDKVSFEQFVYDTEREDEGKTGKGPHIRAVLKMADHIVENNGTLEELHAQIEAVLEKIKV